MVKAVIFDVGGTLLGATDLLENIAIGNTGTKAHDDLYNQLEMSFSGKLPIVEMDHRSKE